VTDAGDQLPPDPGDPVPVYIHDLERMLSVALLVQDIDPGPPATITASGMVDGEFTTLVGRGTSEDDAWRDLAIVMAAWRNVDSRQVRLFLGGY